jgi:hypothetical protein
VARRDPAEPRRPERPLAGRPPGRLRRFVHQYGWRAYAIPLLTLATVLALLDLAVRTPAVATQATATPDVSTPDTSTPDTSTSADVEALSPVDEGIPPQPAQGDAAPSEEPQAADTGTYVEKGAGTVTVVDGAGPVHGSGPLRRFVVEVEDGIGVDAAAFAQAVEATLADPRSWGHDGRMSFQRVGAAEAAAAQYEFKVTLVSPGNMERYCPGVGTGGYTSCRYGERAVINLARWATAVPDYEGDVATYRLYVVNHEVGHVLGNGHRPCPGPGQVAPVMQQQTLGLDGCVKNAWPYP